LDGSATTHDTALAGIARIRKNIQKVFLGKPDVVRLMLVGLLGEGHVLIEDVPGVGKTLLARALARSIDCAFRRIQFTPDMLPADILGVTVYDQRKDEFVFKKGAIFANIVLADEINRTSPRTQSSLLEAMNDFSVSVDGATYPLARPFMVAATQNPFESEGVYELPDSQMDRFMLSIVVGYPDRDDEREILETHKLSRPLDSLDPVIDADGVVALQQKVREVRMDSSLSDYILEIIHATRDNDSFEVGASPRGSLSLYRACQASALVDGRTFVTPDDVKAMAVPVLAHRVIPRTRTRRPTHGGAQEVIVDILQRIPVPE